MDDKLEIFKSLFKGRLDAFAIRWEKDGKSGYIPAYDLNWEEFRKHKDKGGSLRDFPGKKYAVLTDYRLDNHLSGREIVGIYPLLQDNTSWFIAADFDETISNTKSWITECTLFIAECEKYQMPVYVVRSRSGAGGHVWLFFENEYPAVKSRQIFKHLLKCCGIVANKNSSFDRLFPNQDYHSGKELGNLIALPLQKGALEKQNSCFINLLTQEPFADQWEFLKSIQKISIVRLDELYNEMAGKGVNRNDAASPIKNQIPGKLHIILDNQIILLKAGLPNLLLRYLRDSLNLINTAYILKKNAGKNTFGTERYLISLDSDGDHLVIPRGFIRNLIGYCKEHRIDYFLEDKRVKLEPIDYSFSGSLYPYQQAAVDITNKKDFGVIVSPPGSGKTIMGLSIIANKKQPALIIVHRRQLFD